MVVIKSILAAICVASSLGSTPIDMLVPQDTVIENELQQDTSIVCRYSFNQLETALEQEVYNVLLEGITEHRPVIYVDEYRLDSSDLESIAFAVASDNPDLFWFEGEVACSSQYDVSRVLPHYNLTLEQVNEYKDELSNAVDDMVTEFSGNSDYFKLSDAFVRVLNTKYSDTGDLLERTPVGTLLNGESLCAGKTQALAYIYHEMGFNTVYDSAKMKSGSYHIWLAVEFRGRWYNVDPTYGEFMLAESSLKDIDWHEGIISVPITYTYTFNPALDSMNQFN